MAGANAAAPYCNACFPPPTRSINPGLETLDMGVLEETDAPLPPGDADAEYNSWLGKAVEVGGTPVPIGVAATDRLVLKKSPAEPEKALASGTGAGGVNGVTPVDDTPKLENPDGAVNPEAPPGAVVAKEVWLPIKEGSVGRGVADTPEPIPPPIPGVGGGVPAIPADPAKPSPKPAPP